MELLEKYSFAIICINGLNTFVISPMYYGSIIDDVEFLKSLNMLWARDIIINMIQTISKVDVDKLCLAIVEHKGRIEKFKWEPVVCYKNKDAYYHVIYRNSWMCRGCNNVVHASMIMPISEGDCTFYSENSNNRYPNIEQLFQKIPCNKCGRLLQNHIFIMDR